MFNNRQKRDVERLTGRRGNKDKRAILWDQIDALSEKVATKLASSRFGAAVGPYIKAASVDEDALDTLVSQTQTVATINQAINTATTFIDNLTADARGTLPDLDQAITDAKQTSLDAVQVTQDEVDALVGAYTGTLPDLDQAITDALSYTDAQIEASELILQGNIDTVSSSLANNYYTITQADSAISAATLTLKSDLEGQIGTLNATLTNDYLTSTDVNQAISAAQTELQSNIDGVSASLSSEQTTRASADSAITLDLTALTSRVGDAEADISSEQIARANADDALAADITSLTSRVGDAEADISSEQTTRASADSALASDIDAVESRIDDAEAAITSEQIARTDADTALASDISTVSSNLAATDATVTQAAAAIATVEGYQAASYTLRVAAGGAEGTLEFVAADDPINGPASGLRISVDMVDIEGRLNADWITSGLLRAQYIVVDDLLSLDAASAGFSMGKPAAYDSTTDGIYMGRTQELDGSVGFGFSVSKTNDATGLAQIMEATKANGVRMTNANFFRSLTSPIAPAFYTTDQTVGLSTSMERIDLLISGGGGGGGGSDNNTGPHPGQDGGDTVVVLKDGTTTIETWTATGGNGASGSFTSGTSGESGQSSAWGIGGVGGAMASTESYQQTIAGTEGETRTAQRYVPGEPGGDATGFGAGGGGGGDNSFSYAGLSGLRGEAGQFLSIIGYDISGLTDPKLEITIGAGGAGATTGGNAGGDGTPGRIKVAENNYVATPADVIPLSPTYTGTMSSDGPFPDYGAGLWVIQGTSPTGGDTEIDAGGATIGYTGATTFVSSKTPVVVNPSGASFTRAYRFYKMGD